MPEDMQAKMEGAFGKDFSGVRIHEGARSEALGALAYTQGTDIHFAPGQYQPNSQHGQALLGHELTHVVQQSQGRVTAATTQARGVVMNDDAGLEREADEMGARAARGEGVEQVGTRVPDLHAAAHEVAHVVQQRSGVNLADGVGKSGGSGEQQADRVADAVVHGESAEALLDGKSGDYSDAVQRKEEPDATGTHKPGDPHSKIGALHPSLQAKARTLIAEANKRGLEVFIFEGLRSIARQNKLYAQGRTKSGNKVTWVKGGDSYHNYGLAIDVVFHDKAPWDESHDWTKLGEAGEAAGLTWGGRWKKSDRPHFQMQNLTIATIKQWFVSGGMDNVWAKVDGGAPGGGGEPATEEYPNTQPQTTGDDDVGDNATGFDAASAAAFNKSQGYSAEQWKKIQEAVGVDADGLPGKQTATAVQQWQEANNLQADGKVGAATLEALSEAGAPEAASADGSATASKKPVPKEINEHLSLREGFKPVVYLDSLNKLTVGTGHLLTPDQQTKYPEGSTVPKNVLKNWLEEDSTDAHAAAGQMAMDIKIKKAKFQELVNALTSVNFQLGTAWNKKHKKTWKHLKERNWTAAAKEAADSSWFKQTPVRVIDFQRVLLNIAGKATDYKSLRAFNKDAIAKRKVEMPSQQNVEAFVPKSDQSPSESESGSKPDDGQSVSVSVDDNTKALFKAKSKVDLNVRLGPGVNYGKAPKPLRKGTEVEVFQEKSSWYRIGEGQWVSGSLRYIERMTQSKQNDSNSNQQDPQQVIDQQFQRFNTGEIGMPDLARSMKPYAKSHGTFVVKLLGDLASLSQDNFAYALAANSRTTELANYDRTLLFKMSEALDALLTLSRADNLRQKKRIDTVLGALAKASVTKALAKSTTSVNSSDMSSESEDISSSVKDLLNTWEKEKGNDHKGKAYLTDGNRTADEQLVIVLESKQNYLNSKLRFKEEFNLKEVPTSKKELTSQQIEWWIANINAQAGKSPGYPHVGGNAQDVSVKNLDIPARKSLKAKFETKYGILLETYIPNGGSKYNVSIDLANLFHVYKK